MKTFNGLSLTRKLILAFLLVAVTAAGLVAVMVRLSNPERLNQLIFEQNLSEFKAVVIDYYRQTGSLENISYYLLTSGVLPPLVIDNPFPQPGERVVVRMDRRRSFALVNVQGEIIHSMLPELPVGARVTDKKFQQGEVITVDNVVIGVILTSPQTPDLTPEEEAYLSRTNQALLLAGIGGVLTALLAGALLARSLTRPLRELTAAAERMERGQLEQVVEVRSGDEIGQLTHAFNRMSSQVAKANQIRRQMTADIAHDLRTPLTVIAGYVESMRDEVLAPTPARLGVIYGEIERLQHLVEDLRTLTRADAGELGLVQQELDTAGLLNQLATTYQLAAEQREISLRVVTPPSLPAIIADEARLAQVLDNLITNALRYTPPGGTITLSATAEANEILVQVEDSGPGISAEDLPHIFDRFYRADKARSGDDGTSGLGLAIARAIVQAHGGTIKAETESGKGSIFSIRLPAAKIV